jgi:hypothetical protein
LPRNFLILRKKIAENFTKLVQKLFPSRSQKKDSRKKCTWVIFGRAVINKLNSVFLSNLLCSMLYKIPGEVLLRREEGRVEEGGGQGGLCKGEGRRKGETLPEASAYSTKPMWLTLEVISPCSSLTSFPSFVFLPLFLLPLSPPLFVPTPLPSLLY